MDKVVPRWELKSFSPLSARLTVLASIHVDIMIRYPRVTNDCGVKGQISVAAVLLLSIIKERSQRSPLQIGDPDLCLFRNNL